MQIIDLHDQQLLLYHGSCLTSIMWTGEGQTIPHSDLGWRLSQRHVSQQTLFHSFQHHFYYISRHFVIFYGLTEKKNHENWQNNNQRLEGKLHMKSSLRKWESKEGKYLWLDEGYVFFLCYFLPVVEHELCLKRSQDRNSPLLQMPHSF